MSDIRYVRNSAGIEEILLGPAMGAAMVGYATDGLAVFESVAPRVSNRYAESGEVHEGLDHEPTPRACAHLFATVDYASAVEAKHHTLSRVADTLEAL